jgi:succinyl-diaminopimelate desuccinylase
MITDIITLSKELISIPSVDGDKDRMIEVLEVAKKYLPEYAFTPFASNGSPSLLFSNGDKSQKQFKIILSGHLDVVPALEEQFHPYVEDDKLYGRGAKDMKAAAAVMILLFKELGKTLPYSLGLQLTTDEEIGGENGVKHQIAEGVRADFAIIGESTDFRIIHETKAIINIKLTSKGKAAHSAYPWLGKNAVWNMYEALENVMKAYPIPQEETAETTVTISKIETENKARNIVPADCAAYLNVRYVLKEKETIIPKLQSLLPEGIGFEVINEDVPHSSDPNGFYFKHFKKCSEEILQTEVPLAKAHGASDARYFTQVGCDAAEFGPVGQGHHAEEEFTYTKSLVQYYEILKTFLTSIK